MINIIFEIVALLAIGWVAGAEIGSWFGIQPIVGRLSYEQQVDLEQAMLKSFGRVMPIIMPFSAVVAFALAFFARNDPSVVIWLRLIAALCIVMTIVTTLTINVPINNLTAKWQLNERFEKWAEMRSRWHLFQGIRGGLFLLSFILLTVASTIQRHL